MMIAAEDPPAGAGTEVEELESLVPRSSPLRIVVLTLVVALVLAAAWFSPAVLRPSLDSLDSGSATALQLDDARQLLTTSPVAPRAWPWATLTEVEPVPGAEVAAVWLLPADSEPAVDDVVENPGDALEVLRGTYPDADVQPGGNLPHRFASGDVFHVVILWDVHDCAALEPDTQPQATVRTALGTIHADPLWEANAPGFLLAGDDGTDSALCGE